MGTAETALLVISDLHYGKSTPSYNPDVFKQRMAGLDDKIRDIKKCLGTYKFDGLRVAILGDAVDGSEIFATQPHHQAVSSAEQQAYELSGLLAEWLVGQKKVWRNLSVDCVTGNHGRCHDAETELLTQGGWRKHESLKAGDTVATMTATGIMEWQQLLAVYRYHHCGDMYHWKDRETDVMVTPNHHMLFRMSTGKSATVLCEMQEWDRVGKPEWAVPRVPFCNLSADYKGVTDDELRLMAWIITDGCYHKGRNGWRGPCIYQSKEHGVQAITELLDRMDFSYSKRMHVRKGPYQIRGVECLSRKDNYEFYIKASHAGRVFELLPDKRELPHWVFSLSRRQVDVFLGALIDGDGSRWGKSRCLWGRKQILDDIHALLASVGIRARLCVNKRGHFLSIGTSEGASLWAKVRAKRVKRIPYNGIVWCGAVPNGTLVTRRSGSVIVSGNSSHFAHENSNFDLVTYRYLQHSLKGKIDVHFDPLQPFIRKLDIHGNKILLYHGHEIRSFANIPWYGISMRVNRWLSTGFAPFDTVFMGHFHTTGYWPINRIKLFCTGTMVTDDDYPLLGMGLESSNKWWLVGVHPERGITFSFDLDLVN